MTDTPPEPPDIGPEGPAEANDPETGVDGGADGPPRDEVDEDLDDPIEPRLSRSDDADLLGKSGGDETLVSKGDPPSTTE